MEKRETNNCIINLRSLGQGTFPYEFDLDALFFKSFENEDIINAAINVDVEVEKSHNRIGVSCDIYGEIVVECDRCMDDLIIPIDFSRDFTVKFTELRGEDEENDEGIILMDSSEANLDLNQVIYDYICLNLPLIKVHNEGDCNPEMIKK